MKNSEVFVGKSFTVIARSDCSFGSHGGVLVGASNDVNANIKDVTIADYEFSLACVVVDIKHICFVLIYFPLSTSEVTASMSYQCGFGDDYILYIHGHFSFPVIDWSTLSSSDTIEETFIETFDLLAVSQLIDLPTHKLGNTLDLILTNDTLALSMFTNKCFLIIFQCYSKHLVACLNQFVMNRYPNLLLTKSSSIVILKLYSPS